MTRVYYSVYGARGEWKANLPASSHEDALHRSREQYPKVVALDTPYIVVLDSHPGHGAARLLKLERIEVPQFKVVQA